MNTEYNELVLRNGYFISDKLQKKISETTLVFIGCGLSSSLIMAATRMGFQNFILHDGDTVERSNLNRQDFYISDIGKNKAKAIAERVLKINPAASVLVNEKFVEVDDVTSAIEGGQVVINCADFNNVTYEIEKKSTAAGKLSISPLNIGFGTITLAFTNASVSLYELTNGVAKSDKKYLLNLYKGLEKYKLPKYVSKKLPQIFLYIAKKGFFPQNIIAANMSVAAILDTIIRYLDGKEIKLAPVPVSIDMEAIYE